MTPQEAQIIRDVFAKIRQMGPGANDPEAARAVEVELRANPAAALGLVQVVVGLERERDAYAAQIGDLTARIQELEARLPPSGGGLFGGPAGPGPWSGGPTPAPLGPPPPSGPWGQAPSAGPWGGAPQAPQSGGFWGSALRTGAGVAGGLFAFEALRGLFGGHGGGFGGPTTASGLFDPGTTVVENVNVFEGGGGGGGGSPGLFGSTPPDGAPGGGGFLADDIDFGGGSDDGGYA